MIETTILSKQLPEDRHQASEDKHTTVSFLAAETQFYSLPWTSGASIPFDVAVTDNGEKEVHHAQHMVTYIEQRSRILKPI